MLTFGVMFDTRPWRLTERKETPMPTPAPRQPPVIELRQYTLHSGRRDELITLFEHEFVETQEAVGMAVLGTFTDLDDADRFVWLRGFADMASRADALGAFYGGPVWRAHRDAANPTMIDSDNVLLLRAVTDWPLPQMSRAPVGATTLPHGVLIAAVIPWDRAPAAHAHAVDRVLADFMRSDAPPLAALVTEPAPNNFPRLPVREKESVLVMLSLIAAKDVHATSAACQQRLRERLPSGTQVMRLAPTPRSTLHA
jgi:hypothetical protein